MNEKFSKLKKKAFSLGATEFGISKRKNKKYFVIYKNKIIHFGDSRYKDFSQHGNTERRRLYLARHTKIKNKQGEFVYKLKTSASFWSLNLLWN